MASIRSDGAVSWRRLSASAGTGSENVCRLLPTDYSQANNNLDSGGEEMKAVFRLRFGLMMLLALAPLAGCCSSLGTGGGSKPTYIIVPAGQPIPGHPGMVAPSQ